MWIRKELKAKAKTAFLGNYWRCVLVAFIIFGLIGVGVASNAGSAGSTYNQQIEGTEAASAEISGALSTLSKADARAVIFAVLGVLAAVVSVTAIIRALIVNPLEVGARKFFLVNSDDKAELSELLSGYRKNYLKNFLALLLRDIYLALWGFLCVIPAVVKSYSYRLVPYILNDNPNIGANEAITRSRQMMKGHKWNTFVLDLSFIGWALLAAVTLGLVGVFYLNPYIYQTDAELYKAIRDGN